MKMFTDRIHRLPRLWSNRELKKFAHLFKGDVVNVSGWKDIDKEGRYYKDYFVNANSYTITNYISEFRGFQGLESEIFLDLESDLPAHLRMRFEIVFNHTTLEHIFRVQKAFSNLCDMSNDIVILVVPFLQPYHAAYGDFWRFSPLAIKNMFEDNEFTLLYQSFNNHLWSSVYTFSIASKVPQNWTGKFNWSFSAIDPKSRSSEPYIGCNAIPNAGYRIKSILRHATRLRNAMKCFLAMFSQRF